MSLATKDNTITLLSNYKNNLHTYVADINYFKQGNPERNHLEAFISSIFKQYYNAEIDHFSPNLLAIESSDGNHLNAPGTIKAVAGVRCAAEEVLFSEFYLSKSLEKELGLIYNKKISRSDIVEVGNLAPANVGHMHWLIAAITGFLYSAGFKYIVFTAVPGIYNAFNRMDVPLKIITEAKQKCLPDDIQHKWGPEYYELKPMVLSGDIVQGFNIMKKNIYSTNQKLIPLFEKACSLGQNFQIKGNVA